MVWEKEIQDLERRLRDYEQEILRLQTEIDHVDLSLRRMYEKEVQTLQEMHRLGEQRLAELHKREAGSWVAEDLRAGILYIFDQLGRRIDRLISR